jgi:hypothetical protein
MKAYADLADLPEDDRIAIIGETAQGGPIVGFVVEDQAKADRYIAQLTARYQVKELDRKPLLTGILVRIIGTVKTH